MTTSSQPLIAYLAPEGLEACVEADLQNVLARHGRLFIAQGPLQQSVWSQNIWLNPQRFEIKSIGDAVKILRGLQRNWVVYAFKHHRRCELIQKQLPFVSAKPLAFLESPPKTPLGSWTLLDEHTLLVSSECSSPVPHGVWNFIEDRENPPSRAYLKLWEFFTRQQKFPTKSDVCLDLGASPGGWTWVLAQLSKRVLAYDRSVLAPEVASLPNVEFFKGDGFKVVPELHPEVSWVFSDLICYPEKLYEYVQSYVHAYPKKNYVFTIKFQGGAHYGVIEAFSKIPGSQILHLSHNKHELTWCLLQTQDSGA